MEQLIARPTVTVWGAARSVSGSMHLVEAAGRRILLDCGLTQGRRDESRRRNANFPFHPDRLDAVVLSHAHIDHCGNIPTLAIRGYRGPVYCTPATADLLPVMLDDSAKIQEEEAAHANIRRNYQEPWERPLYTRNDARSASRLAVPLPRHMTREIVPGVRLTFLEAGHILGSATVHLTFDTGESMLFTGDLGRSGSSLLPPADLLPPVDTVLCESTYGGVVHEPVADTAKRLIQVVKQTIARGGKVFIPAFSLGRTQLVVYYLTRAIQSGELPSLPIWVDGPLATEVAAIHQRHPEALLPELRRGLIDNPSYLDGPTVQYVREFDESLWLTTQPGAHVVVAASGMCEAGRILDHLRHHIDDPRCTVVLVSYQAAGTLGRMLLEKSPTVRFLGRTFNKWAEIVHLDGFSGHADHTDLMAYLTPRIDRVKRVRLVHGDYERSKALATALRDAGFADVAVPEAGERIEIG
jgi:metallo-beta-lactamase family protein